MPTLREGRNATKCEHTDRRECAKGLCGSCYNRRLMEINPEFKARQRLCQGEYHRKNKAKYDAMPSNSRVNRRRYEYHSHIRSEFHLEPSEYYQMVDRQGGVCAICGRTEPHKAGKLLCVDHSHTTGNVRGLLCSNCNCALGFLKESTSKIFAAIHYLETEPNIMLPMQPTSEWKKEHSSEYEAYAAKYSLAFRGGVAFYRRRRYGIEPHVYAEMMEKQGGKCSICGETRIKQGELSLCVDHSHVTGNYRGLLCPDCNSGIGMFHDDIVTLKLAIKYLKVHDYGGN